MLKHRNFVSFFSTIFLYIGIGISFFYLQNTYIGTEQKPEEKIISFSLSEYEPEPPPVEEFVPEEPEVQEVEIVEPEPIVEEKKPEEPKVEEVVPEPIVEKKIPKPIVKKVVKKKKPKKKIRKRVKKRVHKKVVSKKVRKKVKTASRVKASLAKKKRFKSQLRAKINKYKTYPRIAQKRGMRGVVKVRFTIFANGHVGNITVNGKKVFASSARKAIQKAFPINPKNVPFSLPDTINLTLRYQLK